MVELGSFFYMHSTFTIFHLLHLFRFPCVAKKIEEFKIESKQLLTYDSVSRALGG